jgi:hypothetical protein
MVLRIRSSPNPESLIYMFLTQGRPNPGAVEADLLPNSYTNGPGVKTGSAFLPDNFWENEKIVSPFY